MGFALALGQFVGGAATQLQKDQDLNEQNDLATQRQLMQDWSTTVLPQVMKQRQLDNANLAMANDAMATDPRLQNKPLLAFQYAKMKADGTVTSTGDYFDKVNTGAVQPPVDQQVSTLESQGFSVARDQSGNVTGMSFNPQSRAKTAAQIPGSGQGASFADHLLGRKAPVDVAQGAANKFAAATGVDPTQGVNTQFGNTQLTGLNAPMKSPEALALQAKTATFGIDHPELLRDPNKVYEAAQTGDVDKINAAMKGNVMSAAEASDISLNKQFRLHMLETVVTNPNAYNDPSALKDAIGNPKTSVADLAKVMIGNAKSPEALDKEKLRLLGEQKLIEGLSDDKTFRALDSQGAYNNRPDLIDPKALSDRRAEVENSVNRTVDPMTGKTTVGGGAYDPNAPQGQKGAATAPTSPFGAKAPPPPPASGAGYTPPGAAQPAATTPAPTYTPPAVQPQATTGGSPNTAQATPQPTQGGVELPTRSDGSIDRSGNLPAGTPFGQGPLSKALGQLGPRVGDSTNRDNPFVYNAAIQTKLETSSPEAAQHMNPFTVLQAAQHLSTTKKVAEAARLVKNATFNKQDLASMQKNPQLQDLFMNNVTSHPQSITYNSMQDAAKNVPVGGAYFVQGETPGIRFMDPATKQKYTAGE